MRRLAAVLVAAALAVVVVLALGRGGGTGSVEAAAAVSARATFTPPVVEFGDRFTAAVSVVLDTGQGQDVQVQASLVPLEQLSAPRVTRTTRGGAVIVRYAVDVACLDQVCAGAQRAVHLAPARVSAGTRSSSVAWPQLLVRGRVGAAELAKDPPPLVADASVPPVTYRVRPATLALVLNALAVLLALAGVALGARQALVLARERAERASRVTQFERALVLARDAETRDPADRRRAVGLLARLLARRGEPIAEPARDLAWSAQSPRPEEIEELVAEIERELR